MTYRPRTRPWIYKIHGGYDIVYTVFCTEDPKTARVADWWLAGVGTLTLQPPGDVTRSTPASSFEMPVHAWRGRRVHPKNFGKIPRGCREFLLYGAKDSAAYYRKEEQEPDKWLLRCIEALEGSLKE